MKLEGSGSNLTKAAVMKEVKQCFSRNLDCFTLGDSLRIPCHCCLNKTAYDPLYIIYTTVCL